ncbi:MAG: phage head-tail connector protein [Lachnospiraceae bacterium]|nr:phage head-tail connector protein [Lachnospiraceae bacterium]
MTQAILERVKRRIDPNDEIGTEIEDQLRDIIGDVEAQLRVKLGGVETIPTDLDYIVVAVSVKTYNRIGSEGAASHTVEGETMTWSADPFAEFERDITDWRNACRKRRPAIKFL